MGNQANKASEPAKAPTPDQVIADQKKQMEELQRIITAKDDHIKACDQEIEKLRKEVADKERLEKLLSAADQEIDRLKKQLKERPASEGELDQAARKLVAEAGGHQVLSLEQARGIIRRQREREAADKAKK